MEVMTKRKRPPPPPRRVRDPERFAARVIALREALDWTRYRLAKESGVSQTQMIMLERGHVSPRWPTVCRLADALGCSTEDLC